MASQEPNCEIRLFGTPAIQTDGVVASGLRNKSLALLAYLTVERRPVGRDTVATLLWPASGQSAARRNLRTCLHELRQALPPGAVISKGASLELNPEGLRIDIHRFLALPDERPDAREIAAICPAPFLEGFTLVGCAEFDAWQIGTSKKLLRRLETLLAAAVRILLRGGDAHRAIPHCHRLIDLDPLEESSHRLAMRTYAACGRWAAAERQYEACRRVLQEDLGATPEAETEALANAIVRRDQTLYSGGTRQPAIGVPAEVSAFFGRTAEIREISERLDSGRIVTLTGPGGSGKTRLAIHAAHALADRYPAGTAFADLSPARNPDQVMATLTRAIGLREQISRGESHAEILARHLSGRCMLILLDNFEHVIEASAQIADLMEGAADVQVLITSRQPLAIRGEAVVVVPPLDVPESTDAETLHGSPAVKLLLDRARLADPSFRLTEENAGAIRDLCVALDGLPLAIELAIPLLQVYSPAELVGRLARPLRVLQTGGADRPERHRSLESAIGWSFDLLDNDERELFCALSVFAGSFDLAAVAAVSPGGRRPVEVRLQALLEKNLVQRRNTSVGVRFELLESMREYAAEQAKALPRCRELVARHADYYRSLALEADRGLRGPQQVRWLTTLALAGGDVALALTHFGDVGRWETGLETACSLGWYWYRCGQFRFGSGWLDRFLSRCLDVPSELRARGLHLKGWLTFVAGDWLTGHGLYGESLYMARQVASGTCECLALSDLGVSERWLGNRARGWDYALKAVEVARGLGDAGLLGRALIWAYATTGGTFVGEPPVTELEETAALGRETGDEWIFVHAYHGLGDLFRELGQYNRSRQAYETALGGFQRLQDHYLSAWTLEGLGVLDLKVGDRRGALERTVQALTLFDGMGDEMTAATMLARIATLGRGLAPPENLARIGGAAWVLLERRRRRGVGAAPQIVEAFESLAGLGLEQTAAWLEGETLSRAAAVAAARDLVAGG